MAALKTEKKKRKSKRKSRTEVSSSSSSSDDEYTTSSPKRDVAETEQGQQNPEYKESADDMTPQGQATPEEAFADFYLRQTAGEFANDLDKLRSASDFHGQRSVEVLVAALRQGTQCFDPSEVTRIGRAAGESSVNR